MSRMATSSPRRSGSRVGPGVRAWVLRLVGRFLAGRVLVSSRATDATFLHRARFLGGGWWASRAGWVRSLTRLCPLLLVAGWVLSPLWTVVALSAGAAVAVRWAAVRRRARRHERRWVEPLWPAIADILGDGVADGPPRSWVEFPRDPAAVGAEIVVALPDRLVDDATRAAKLRVLFTERLELGPWVEQIEPWNRTVVFGHRPLDPPLWAPLARLLQLDPAGRPGEWIDMPADVRADDAQIRVRLPDDVPDDRALGEALARIADQRLPKRWTYRIEHRARVCLLVRRPPEKTPPPLVDLTAGAFPEIDELLSDDGVFIDIPNHDIDEIEERKSA